MSAKSVLALIPGQPTQDGNRVPLTRLVPGRGQRGRILGAQIGRQERHADHQANHQAADDDRRMTVDEPADPPAFLGCRQDRRQVRRGGEAVRESCLAQ